MIVSLSETSLHYLNGFYEEMIYPQYQFFQLIFLYSTFFTIAIKSFISANINYYIMKNICDGIIVKISEYKAHIEKDNSKKYRMLCLEHVKEFNKIGIIFQA